MIAIHVKGRGARGLLDYLTAATDHKGAVRPSVADLGGTLPGSNVREMARSMGALHAARPSVSRYVAHAMLRWDEGSGDAPDLDVQADMMRDHMEAMGFRDYRIFSHGTEVHGIASRILPNGSVVDERNDWRLAENSCRALEIKYGLRRLESSPNADPERAARQAADPQPSGLSRGEMGMAHRAMRDAERQERELDLAAMPSKPQLADAVLAAREAALRDGSTVGAFVRACHRAGVEVRPNWSPATGKVSGLSFFMSGAPEVEVSASKISRSLSWANMQKGGLGYEFSRDGAELRTASERAEGLRPGRASGPNSHPGNPDIGGPGGGIPPIGRDDGGPDAGRGVGPSADGRLARPDGKQFEQAGRGNERRPIAVAGSGGEQHGGAGSQVVGGGRGDGELGRGFSSEAGRGRDERRPDRESTKGSAAGHGRYPAEDGSSNGSHDEGGRLGSATQVDRAAGNGASHGDAHEHLVSLVGVEDVRLHTTLDAVGSAVRAIGEPFYVVGILPPRGTPPDKAQRLHTLHKTYSAKQLAGAPVVKYLRAMNAQGHDIYFKPAGTGEGKRPAVVMLDDLRAEDVARMKADGLAPCLEITSSPGNHQAWIRLGNGSLPIATLRQVARDLAATYGGDLMAAKGEQFGRLPGFTNRKPKRIAENGGQAPFALVVEAVGLVASKAAQVIRAASAILRDIAAGERRREAAAQARAAQRAQERQHEEVFASVSRHMRTSGARQGGVHGLSEVDFAAACGAIRDGHSHADIIAAMRELSPNLEARHARPDDYLRRTVDNADAAVAASGYRR